MAVKKILLDTLNKYCNILAPGWDVSIDYAELNTDRYAECHMNSAERKAIIKLNKFIAEEDIPETIIHELIHIALRDYGLVINRLVEESIPCSQQTLINTLLNDQEERICDTLAFAFLKLDK